MTKIDELKAQVLRSKALIAQMKAHNNNPIIIKGLEKSVEELEKMITRIEKGW